MKLAWFRMAFVVLIVCVLAAGSCRSWKPQSAGAQKTHPPDTDLVNVHFEWLAADPAGEPAPSRQIWLMRLEGGEFARERIDEPLSRDEKLRALFESKAGPTLVARAKPFLMPRDGVGYFIKLIAMSKSGLTQIRFCRLYDPRPDSVVPPEERKFARVVQYKDTGAPEPLETRLVDAVGTPVAGADVELHYRLNEKDSAKLWEGDTDSKGTIPVRFHFWFEGMSREHVYARSGSDTTPFATEFMWVISHRQFPQLRRQAIFRAAGYSADPYFIYEPIPLRSNRVAWKETVEGRIEIMQNGKPAALPETLICLANSQRSLAERRNGIMRSATVLTDKNGRFALHMVEPSEIEAIAYGIGNHRFGKVTPGTKNLNFVFPEPPALTLQLLGGDGKPLGNAKIKTIEHVILGLRGENSRVFARGLKTDAQGRFTLHRQPGERLLVTTSSPEIKFDYNPQVKNEITLRPAK